jgi:ribosomal protein S8
METKPNNYLETEASNITKSLIDALKQEGYFKEYEVIDETIFEKNLRTFVLEIITNDDENELVISEDEFEIIELNSIEQSINSLFNKTVSEHGKEINELIELSNKINAKTFQQNRRGAKTNE